MNLDTADMVEVAEVFQGSFKHVLGNVFGDTHVQILKFAATLVLQEKPYMLTTEEGLKHAMGLVFGNEQQRDFVLALSYTFFARWGYSDEHVIALAHNLARGVARNVAGVAVNNRKEYFAIPNQISERLTDLDDAQGLIASNKWLMVVLMMQLFISIPDPEGSKKPRTGGNKEVEQQQQ